MIPQGSERSKEMEKIFASEARRNVLDANGIKYSVDEELDFYFKSEAEYEKAVKALKNALEI